MVTQKLGLMAVVITGLVLAAGVSPLRAQLSPEVENVFQQLADQLDGDLARLFQRALDNQSDTVEFSADQLRRFRNHPANPFEGLMEIDLGKIRGRIELQFEIPSVRNRRPGQLERQHRRVLEELADVTQPLADSMVSVLGDGQWVAMGCVVGRDGYVLTKASELDGVKNLHCRLSDGTKAPARLMQVSPEDDLALLKVDGVKLTPVVFSDQEPVVGSFVITPGADGHPVAVGACSTPPRSLASSRQPHLGIRCQTTPRGIEINEVTAGSAAHRAGLRSGDILRRIDSVPITDLHDVANAVRQRQPGDRVEIEYERAGRRSRLSATLAGRSAAPAPPRRPNVMNRYGAIPSRRADDFQWVFQHDTPLLPEQCGGPLLDLEGRVIGLNIARAGRVSSYAIPASRVQELVDQMLRYDVALQCEDEAPAATPGGQPQSPRLETADADLEPIPMPRR